MPTRKITSLYQPAIAIVVPDCDPRHVEAYMRLEFSTLDWLSSDRFASEARSAAEVVRADHAAAELLALSYGL